MSTWKHICHLVQDTRKPRFPANSGEPGLTNDYGQQHGCALQPGKIEVPTSCITRAEAHPLVLITSGPLPPGRRPHRTTPTCWTSWLTFRARAHDRSHGPGRIRHRCGGRGDAGLRSAHGALERTRTCSPNQLDRRAEEPSFRRLFADLDVIRLDRIPGHRGHHAGKRWCVLRFSESGFWILGPHHLRRRTSWDVLDTWPSSAAKSWTWSRPDAASPTPGHQHREDLHLTRPESLGPLPPACAAHRHHPSDPRRFQRRVRGAAGARRTHPGPWTTCLALSLFHRASRS